MTFLPFSGYQKMKDKLEKRFLHFCSTFRVLNMFQPTWTFFRRHDILKLCFLSKTYLTKYSANPLKWMVSTMILNITKQFTWFLLRQSSLFSKFKKLTKKINFCRNKYLKSAKGTETELGNSFICFSVRIYRNSW